MNPTLRAALIIIFFVQLSVQSYSQVEYGPKDLVITGFSGGGDMVNLAVSPVDQNLLMLSSSMSGVYLATNGPTDWKMLHHTKLLFSRNARAGFHPKDRNTIFAPGGSGLKVSRDCGKTWQPIGNIGRIEYGLAIHPEHTDLMLAGAGSSVWRSADAGIHWSKVSGPSGSILGFHFDRTSPQGGTTCFAATSAGVWRSADSGNTWVKMAKGLPSGPLGAFAGASNKSTKSTILYCSVGNAVYRSTDQGENWTALSSVSGGATFLLASDANPQIVWAALRGTRISRSTNAGESWTQMYYPNATEPKFNLEPNYFTSYIKRNVGTYIFDAAIAPNNPDFVIFTTSMVCMYTENGGLTWKSGHSKPANKAGEPVPKSFVNTGLNLTTTWHYYVDPFEQNRQYLAYTDLGFARSVDSGESWLFWPYWGPDKKLPLNWVFNLFEIAFDPEIPGKMWGAFSRAHDIPNANSIVRDHYTKLSDAQRKGGIGFSSDFAANWDDEGFNSGLPDRPTLSVIVDPSSPKNRRTLYVAVYDEGVYKSTDDGHHWVKKSAGLGSPSNQHVIRVQIHKDGTLFCLVTANARFSPDGVGLYRSNNGGDTWEKINKSQTFLWPRDFAVNPDKSSEIYVGVHNAGSVPGGLWRTLDGGATWTPLARKGAHFGAYLHPTRPGWIYMTLCEGSDTTSGLWLSKDHGTTWTPYTKIPHRWMQRVDFDPKNPDVIYVSTFGSSALRVPADPEGKL